jgi:hypothetical protein
MGFAGNQLPGGDISSKGEATRMVCAIEEKHRFDEEHLYGSHHSNPEKMALL